MRKSLLLNMGRVLNGHLLVTEFGRPEVTVCS